MELLLFLEKIPEFLSGGMVMQWMMLQRCSVLGCRLLVYMCRLFDILLLE
jgi:hypothetical protein